MPPCNFHSLQVNLTLVQTKRIENDNRDNQSNFPQKWIFSLSLSLSKSLCSFSITIRNQQKNDSMVVNAYPETRGFSIPGIRSGDRARSI